MTQPPPPSSPDPADPRPPRPEDELDALVLSPRAVDEASPAAPPAATLYLKDGNDPPGAASKRPPRRWLRWTLGLGLALLLVAAALLPELISQPPWPNKLAAMAVPNLNGRIEIGALSCGWLSPLAFHDVRLFDAAGKPLAQVSKVVFEKPFWAIAWSPRKLGKIRVVRPEANVEVDGKRSNWDDLVAVPAAPEAKPPAAPKTPAEWGLEVEGGALAVTVRRPGELPKVLHFDDWKAAVSPKADEVVPFEASGAYREGAYQFQLQGRVNPQKQSWEVVVLKASSPEHPWGCDLTGNFANAAPFPLRLGGDVRYDLSALADLLRPTVGPSLELAGARQSQLSAQASLAPIMEGGDLADAVKLLLKQSKANVHLPVDHLRYQGVSVNQLDLAAQLADGRLTFDLGAAQVNEGAVNLRTTVDLVETRKLVVAPGEVVRRVQMTPDVCSGAMRLVAPILADAARASGEFSLTLDDCEIPLDSPKLSRIAGRLSIHSVQVGANDLVKNLAETLKLPGEIRLIDQSVVEFRVEGEAVLHDGLEFVLGPVRIRSHGEVRFDESIQLLLSIQLPSDWKDARPVLRALAGRTIQLPVGGTLRKPQLMLEEALKGNLVTLLRGLSNPSALDGLPQGLGQGGSDLNGGGLERLLLGDEQNPGVVDVVGDLIRRRNEARSAAPAEAPPPAAGGATGSPAPHPRRWLSGDRLRRVFGGVSGGASGGAPPPPSPSPRAPAPPSPAPPPPLPGGREF